METERIELKLPGFGDVLFPIPRIIIKKDSPDIHGKTIFFNF